MIKSYHWFITQAAALLGSLKDLLKGAKNSPKPVDWG